MITFKIIFEFYFLIKQLCQFNTLFGLCELYCTLLCCRDDKIDCKVHYLSLCLHCEYKEREDPYQVSWVTLTV